MRLLTFVLVMMLSLLSLAGEFVVFAGAGVFLDEDEALRQFKPGPLGHYGIAYEERVGEHLLIAGGYRHDSSIPKSATNEIYFDRVYVEILWRF